MAASHLTPHDYTMSRVKVRFPCKAYGSQVAMMNNIIRALQRGQNALLESPTGSGKTLALLCAALAWQREETESAMKYNQAVEQGLIEPEMVMVEEGEGEEANLGLGADGMMMMTEDEARAVAMAKENSMAVGGFFPGNDDDDDFRDDDGKGTSQPSKRPRIESVVDNLPRPSMPLKPMTKKVNRRTVPKIYFGTRTHKQIAQIIRELNKTVYKDVRMTILGSRDHTCIHPIVSKMSNRNEGCKEQMDRKKGGGCAFHANAKSKLSSHNAVKVFKGNGDAWDLEDLVKVGKKARACPYYSTRELMPKSQIVFCPYNYLVEPLIRKSMDISLKGQILILDEAHNIEDSARSAASWQVTQEEVRDAMRDLEKLAQLDADPESYCQLALMCSQLSSWIDSCCNDLVDYKDSGSPSKVWTGTEIVALFDIHGIGHSKFGEFQTHLSKVMAEQQAAREEGDGMSGEVAGLHSNTVGVLEGFFMILNYLYMNGMRHRDDYRVALSRTQVRRAGSGGGNNDFSKKSTFGQWMGKASAGRKSGGGGGASEGTSSGFKFAYTLNFWCLNPAVAFSELKETLHSIILTSGTLSPMTSFSSELDVKFPMQLEANHVIDKKQVWISTISHGPTGHCLNATYSNAQTFGFQDEIGRLTLGVCQKMSYGVLLFLPSYAMLNNLSERWRNTGLWEALSKCKVVISEPRFSDEFEACIRHYYDVIDTTKKESSEGASSTGGVTGALFIAVCRGKVSEGLDFADDHARAVICVGIPFPNVKDIQVDLKKKYNDGRRGKEKTILSGNDWYEIQAFRALNQALGRCIRHRKDWGAILMVDDRYQKVSRYLGSLSKWVRSGVVHFSSFEPMISSLGKFSREMVVMDEADKRAVSDEALVAAAALAAKVAREKEEQETTTETTQESSIASKLAGLAADRYKTSMGQGQRIIGVDFKEDRRNEPTLEVATKVENEVMGVLQPIENIVRHEDTKDAEAVQLPIKEEEKCLQDEPIKCAEVVGAPFKFLPVVAKMPFLPTETDCEKMFERDEDREEEEMEIPIREKFTSSSTQNSVKASKPQKSLPKRNPLSRKRPVQYVDNSDDDFV